MVLSDFSIKRPITISMIVLGVLLLGLVSVGGIPVNLLPDVSFPKVTIRTEYPQAAPSEVENMVTRPIEQVVGVINRVARISSISKSGLSDVVVEFEWGTDLDLATMDIREKLQVLQFPDDVKKPVLLRYDPSQDPVMTLGITGDMPASELRYFVEQEVQLPLERLDGVAAVKVQGGYEEEILVAVNEAKMTQMGITISQVINRLDRENINLAGGTLRDAGSELAVRTSNAFTGIEDIKSMVIVPEGIAPGSATTMEEAMPELKLGALSGLASLLGMAMPPGQIMEGLSGTGVAGLEGMFGQPMPTSVKLKDFAEVSRKQKRREEIARLDGKDCIQVSIYKEGDANIVSVCRLLRRTVERIKGSLRKSGAEEPIPEWGEVWDTLRGSAAQGLRMAEKKLFAKKSQSPEELISDIKIVPIVDQAVFIEKAIDSVYESALMGAVIAIFVIYFFLRSFKSTLIISISIPTSIIATFILMYFFHITWNIISLGGLALGVGILVDNSIVVLENIYRIRETEGGSATETASRGSSQVGMAVTAATLTNIVVFFPLIFVTGVAGQVFRDLALTVTFSMLLSLVAAFTLVPILSVVFKVGFTEKDLPPETMPEKPPRLSTATIMVARGFGATIRFFSKAFNMSITPLVAGFNILFNAVKARYPRFIEYTVTRYKKVVPASVLLAFVSVVVVFIVGFELLPAVDQGEFTVHMEMPVGTPIEETNRKVEDVEKAFNRLRGNASINHLFTSVGYGVGQASGAYKKSENISEIQVTMLRDRLIGDFQAMNILRDSLSKTLAGAEIKMSRPALLSYKTPVELEIVGNNIEELKRFADVMATEIEGVPGIHDVESTGRTSNPEMQVIIDRDRVASLGLTPVQVTDELRKKIKGEVATELDEGERQVDILVRVRDEDRASLSRLGELSISRTAGEPVPLRVLAQLKPAQGPGVINRVGNSRVTIVTADISGRPLGEVVKDIKQRLAQIRLPTGYFWRITGQNEEMRRSLTSLAWASLLAIALVYIVMASLFESLLHPFVIMFTVPYSLVGVALLLLLTGTTLNVFSFIGLIMMFGIAVNDAILYVETANQLRRAGMERKAALIRAGSDRLRPMLVTTLTTVLGMLPMALVSGAGSELRAPIAIVVIGGITSSTFFTLTCIPAVYMLIDRLRPGGGLKPPKDPSESIA